MKAAITGGEVFYESIGAGRAIVVVHGGPGIDHTCFRPWLDPLADGARVVYSDLLGNGRSDRVALTGGMETWADGIDELRAKLGIESMVLFGHSFGGFVAIEYALRHRARLDGLVLCATGPDMLASEVLIANAEARATPSELDAVTQAIGAAAETDDDLRASSKTMLPLYFHRRDRTTASIVETMTAQTRYAAAAVHFGFGECLPAWSGGARLAEIDVPTLVVSGADDWVMPVTQGELLRDGIANAELVVMRESGHFPFIEEQIAFLEAMRGWLTKIRTS